MEDNEQKRFWNFAGPRMRQLRVQIAPIVRNSEDVDDVVQEAMLRALEAWLRAASGDSSVRVPLDGANIGAWLYVIARNVIALGSRYESRRSLIATDEALTATLHPYHWSGSEAATASKLPNELVAVLEDLSPEHREVIVRTASGESYADIATATGVPIGTVMSRVHRARRHCRSILESFGYSGDGTLRATA